MRKFPIAVALNRLELVGIATAMLNGEKDLLEGIREICSLRHAIGDAENRVFRVIRAAESETDHFPLGRFAIIGERNDCDRSMRKRSIISVKQETTY
jgi:hypothetical protein